MNKFIEFIFAVLSHWEPIMGGVIVAALLWVLTWAYNKWRAPGSLPSHIYAIIALTFLFYASYLAWWEMDDKIQDLQAHLDPQIALQVVHDESFMSRSSFLSAPDHRQAKVKSVVRVRVVNIGKRTIGNVKLVLLSANGIESRSLLAPTHFASLFTGGPTEIEPSQRLNSGEDQYFDVLVECNAVVCPKGQLAFATIEGKARYYSTLIKDNKYSEPQELTLRASADIGGAVTKTFVITRGPKGEIWLNEKNTP